jgi:hypothetical protein
MKHIPAFCFSFALTIAGRAHAADPFADPHVDPEAQRRVLNISAYCKMMADRAADIDLAFSTARHPTNGRAIYERVFWDCMQANGLDPPDG